MPLWILSLITLVYMSALVYTHRRMELWVKFSIVVPALCLVGIYTIIDLYDIGGAFRQNTGRAGQAIMLIWYIILLLITKKQHAGVK